MPRLILTIVTMFAVAALFLNVGNTSALAFAGAAPLMKNVERHVADTTSQNAEVQKVGYRLRRHRLRRGLRLRIRVGRYWRHRRYFRRPYYRARHLRLRRYRVRKHRIRRHRFYRHRYYYRRHHRFW